MFIKKDLRKIPEILADAAKAKCATNDNAEDSKVSGILKELRLARRPAEFNGNISILCQPQIAPALSNLQSLSLYDCQISKLDGIGFFASPLNKESSIICCPNLEILNLGRNPISDLPSELALLNQSLKSLWCEDCNLTGPLPDCIYKLDNLETLRLSNNSITEISGEGVLSWKKLKTLCFDGNHLQTIPKEFSKIESMESLMLRNNKLNALPEGVPGATLSNLSFFHISSNEITFLPRSMVDCTSLEIIYMNSNKISKIPTGLATKLSNLTTLNFCSNNIKDLPEDFVDRFGLPNDSGECIKEKSCIVRMEQNPVLDHVRNSIDATMTEAAMNY